MTYQEIIDKRNIVAMAKLYKTSSGEKLQKGIFNEMFDDEVIVHPTGGLLDDDINIIMGDIKEVYEKVRSEIKKLEDVDIINIGEIISKIVNEYFGDFNNVALRSTFYKDESLYDIDKPIMECGITKVTDFKGKNAAMCLERAMLAQNILKLLGINSFFKMSSISKNGVEEAHSFNLVEYEGKYYLFDVTRPTLINGNINPILGEITRETFKSYTASLKELIDSNGNKILLDIGIYVKYYNPLIDKEYEVVYYPRALSNNIEKVEEAQEVVVNHRREINGK